MSATLDGVRHSFDPRTLGAMYLWLNGEINGNAGNTWTDLSGNGYNGTLTNGPTFSANNGGTIVLDGVNDYVAVSSIKPSVIGQAWTLSAWLKLTGAQSTKGILAIQASLTYGSPVVLFQRQDSTKVRWFLAGNYRITETVNDNAFVHLALTYDGTVYTSYVNGASSGTYTGTFNSADTTATLYIGNGYNGYISGSVGEVAIHKSALSAAMMSAMYQRSRYRYA